MRIARDAYLFALPLLGFGLIGLYIGLLFLAVAGLTLTAFVLFFFRDPNRSIPLQQDVIVSPADGKVIKVSSGAESTRISIFLSVFDVHVNRAPVSGTITRCEHKRGKYHFAFDDRASVENEQLIFTIGGLTFSLIAGLVARRIVPWKCLGDRVDKGDKIALIRFGSRVDLLVPSKSEVLVSEGDRVKAGSSILARWSGIETPGDCQDGGPS